MECIVYMGEVDVDRQALNVFRMRLLGAEVDAGAVGQPHAEGRGQRGDAGLGGDGRDAPTTASARSWARTPIRGWCASSTGSSATRRASSADELLGGPPDVVVACVGGGSNAMGIFSGFVDTEADLVGVEPAGGAAIGRGVPGVVHGMKSYLLQDEDGQVLEAAVDLGRARLPGRRAGAHPPGHASAGPATRR